MRIKGTTIQPVSPVTKTEFTKDKPREEQHLRHWERFNRYVQGQLKNEKDEKDG